MPVTFVPPSPNMSSIAALGAAVSKSAAHEAAEALSTSAVGMKTADAPPPASFGLLARVVLSVFSVLPTVLYWVTYTLPTWLFTLFSMSLTFTMNFTTLYVSSAAARLLLNRLPGCSSSSSLCPRSATLSGTGT